MYATMKARLDRHWWDTYMANMNQMNWESVIAFHHFLSHSFWDLIVFHWWICLLQWPVANLSYLIYRVNGHETEQITYAHFSSRSGVFGNLEGEISHFQFNPANSNLIIIIIGFMLYFPNFNYEILRSELLINISNDR